MAERSEVDHPWDDPDGDGHNCVTCIAENIVPWRVIYGQKKTALYCHVHKHFIGAHPCTLAAPAPHPAAADPSEGGGGRG